MAHDHGHNHLPFFASPMVRRENGVDFGHTRRSSRERSNLSVDTSYSMNNMSNVDLATAKPKNDNLSPAFRKHAEATTSELFYDLFFVANLTVFSSVKEINDRTTLAQYAGFFSIIWFTWYQVSLYDVRFSMDSFFDRLCKVIQFGVMIGFAVSGPTFDAGENLDTIQGNSDEQRLNHIDDPSLSTFKTITLIMMLSRLVLVAQYVQAILLTRKQAKQTTFPMAMIAGTEFFAALVYGFLYFAFRGLHANAYLTWYVVAFLETATCTAVSSTWRSISFKGTHLVQRMSLLTLIILGEGIILLARTCQTIVKGKIFHFSFSTVANIASCVLIIYFIYMLYFDWIQERHMGTIRQQLWAFLHFPLHLTLVLSLHGASQFTAWRAATVRVNSLLVEYSTWDFSAASLNATVQGITNSVNEIITDSLIASKSLSATYHFINANGTCSQGLRDMMADGTNSTDASEKAELIYNTLINTIYTSIGFEAADAGLTSTLTGHGDGAPDLEEVNAENQEVFKLVALVFVLFFVCLGVFVILTGLIAWLAKRDKNFGDRIRLGTNFLVGVTLCFVACAAVEVNMGREGVFMAFVYSPWVLPTAMMLVFIVVVLDNVKLPGSRAALTGRIKRPSRRRSSFAG